MTYTSDIPISGETLGSTRDRIRGNFQEIAAVEAINHVAFNAIGKGKHKYLQMPEVTASGVGIPVTLANEGGVYVDVATNPAEANLFFRGENNGFQYQLTRVNQTKNATFGTYTNYPPSVANQNGGWTFLPGGLILQYGSMVSTGSNTTVTFPIAFTTVNAVVTITRESNTGSAGGAFNITQTNFVMARGGSSNTKFYWTAVGI